MEPSKIFFFNTIKIKNIVLPNIFGFTIFTIHNVIVCYILTTPVVTSIPKTFGSLYFFGLLARSGDGNVSTMPISRIHSMPSGPKYTSTTFTSPSLSHRLSLPLYCVDCLVNWQCA